MVAPEGVVAIVTLGGAPQLPAGTPITGQVNAPFSAKRPAVSVLDERVVRTANYLVGSQEPRLPDAGIRNWRRVQPRGRSPVDHAAFHQQHLAVALASADGEYLLRVHVVDEQVPR